MEKVTMTDVQDIISGKAISISLPNPFDEGKPWYVKQPEDYLYDLAQAVQDAAIAKAQSDKTIQSVAHLPPSDVWIWRQENAIRIADERIAELEAKGDAIDPLEAVELATKRAYRERLISPKDYSRAQEIVTKYALKRFEAWLMPRLIVNKDGDLYCDPETEIGKKRWASLSDDQVTVLKGLFYRALDLENIAKN